MNYRAEKIRFVICCNSQNKVAKNTSHSDICRITEHGNTLKNISNSIFAKLAELKFNYYIDLETKKKQIYEYILKFNKMLPGVPIYKKINEYNSSNQTNNLEEKINELCKFIEDSII